MMRVGYRSGTFLTSDLVAGLLLEYALLLREADIAGHVEVPTVASDGQVVAVRVALLPGFSVVAVAEESGHPDPCDENAVSRIRRAMWVLRRCRDE